ncbi:hypothetical protein MCEMAEM4_03174 [Burkholderiaceae bacterium]|jgi:hypothetical protein
MHFEFFDSWFFLRANPQILAPKPAYNLASLAVILVSPLTLTSPQF